MSNEEKIEMENQEKLEIKNEEKVEELNAVKEEKHIEEAVEGHEIDENLIDENPLEEELTNNEEVVVKPKRGFFNFLKASLIDTFIIVGISVVTLYLFDLILRLALGLFVVDLVSMLLIFTVVVAILYPAIMHTKKAMTFGQKFSKLKIEKID